MKVIILAGGKAARLANSAGTSPKALVKAAGKTLLQHQLNLLKKHGLEDIRLSLGFKSSQIIDYINGKYEYIVEPEPLGTGGAVKFASKGLNQEFLVLNGDILSDLNFSGFIRYFQNSAFRAMIAVCKVQNPEGFGRIRLEKDLIVDFLEKPKAGPSGDNGDCFVSTGMYILSPGIFKNILRTRFSIEKEIFPFLAKKRQLGAFLHSGWWFDAGTEKRLKQAREFLRKKQKI